MKNFEIYKNEYLSKLKDSNIKKALIYVLDGGKRFRARLIFAVLKGFNIDEAKGYDAALALEMIHAYSLVHDDLPCMDDDDMRRGKPSCHIAFNEGIAVLSGDALLTEAFRVIVNSKTLSDTQKLAIIKAYSELAGLEGMIYGQILDLENEHNPDITKELVDKIDYYKTSCLFKAALYAAMYIVQDDNNISFYDTLGTNLGLFFQMQDDLFDVTKTISETGKNSYSDFKEDKVTALKLYNNDINKLKNELNLKFQYIINVLREQKFDYSYLEALINEVNDR